MFTWDDSWVRQSVYFEDGNEKDYQVIMIISDKARFEKEDHGGAIYIVPSQGFVFDENKGLGIYEWTHTVAVTPILEIQFSSALEAMEKHGVKVYFVKKDQF